MILPLKGDGSMSRRIYSCWPLTLSLLAPPLLPIFSSPTDEIQASRVTGHLTLRPSGGQDGLGGEVISFWKRLPAETGLLTPAHKTEKSEEHIRARFKNGNRTMADPWRKIRYQRFFFSKRSRLLCWIMFGTSED